MDARRAVRDPPRGRHARRRARRLGPRGPRRRALGDLWLAQLRRRRRGARRRRRRRRRAVLERHQPGAARRADPRRAGARTATCTSTRACRASTSGGCRRCRSPTSRCSTSSRRRCRGCRSRSSGRSTSPSPSRCCSCCRRCWSLIAVAHQAQDRGPVLFRQRRVGRDGVEFEMLKFRTMCVDAEARLAALRAPSNERTRPAVQARRATRGSPRSGGSCGRPASTSCRSCSTCCAAT